ncbi:hypothetical protein NWP17_03935 [Chrysosporum bergii ANA360D]|uniref:Uncharacterized protein n=1 Tax=Chrysosporum bergii ANA360D TaxID=617107 RepID=A0AA43GQ01_9CYAN|nr:hypothetical protein [Chrysosporum bergii]MDH6059596.1 hypothetical protein [Chrysosporum bergii ANA360D]
MLTTLYLIQQSFNLQDAFRYSVGLVVVCLVMLILLWLPDILKQR